MSLSRGKSQYRQSGQALTCMHTQTHVWIQYMNTHIVIPPPPGEVVRWMWGLFHVSLSQLWHEALPAFPNLNSLRVNTMSKCSKELDIRRHDMETSGKTLHGSVTHAHALDRLLIGWCSSRNTEDGTNFGRMQPCKQKKQQQQQNKTTFIQSRRFMEREGGGLGWGVIMRDDPIG